MPTILTIEDEPHILDNITDLLEMEGFAVVGAGSGEDGLHAARAHRPDLILCDIRLPGCTGYEVLSRLRQDEDFSTTPFIFLTAAAEELDRRKGMSLGADDYLTKPFTAGGLLMAVTSRLDKQAALQKWHQHKMDELRGDLSQVLPHELRTPLSSILGLSQMLLDLQDEMEPDEIRAALKDLHASGKRLERLVENYGFYAQLQIQATRSRNGEASFPGPASEAETSEVAAVVASQARQKAGVFQRPGDLELALAPGTIRLPALYLSKLAHELLDNAFKFSEAGTPVRVQGALQNGHYVLAVSDEGRGLTPDQIDEMGAFRQFDRAEQEQQGVGLGLAIARQIVALCDAELDIESCPGEGTTVRTALPTAAQQPAATPSPRAAESLRHG